jgi:hypothetical protein
VIGLEADLGPREAKSLESGSGVRMIPPMVDGLLRRRAVVAETVGFDDQAEVGGMARVY